MSEHRVIKIEGKWAIKTAWTPDYQAVNRVVKRAPVGPFDWSLKVWPLNPEKDILRTIDVLQEMGIEIPQEFVDLARPLTKKMDADAREADKLAEDKRLFGYQKDGIRTLARMDQFILCDDMGLGKTVQALLAANTEAPILAVVPASLKGNWAKEIGYWRPGTYRVEILEGRGSFRFPQSGEFLITNWDILPKDADQITPEFEAQVPMGLIVIGDEIHQAKNPKTQRARRYGTLNQLAVKYGGKTWGLTGTPLMNRPQELWNLLEVMGLAEKAFGSFGNFYKLFNAQKDSYGTIWGMPEPQVPEMLSKVWLRRVKGDVLPQLPPKRWQIIQVKVESKKLRKDLDEAMRKINSGDISTLENGIPDFRKMSTQRKALAIAKTPALLKLVETYEEEDTPVVVFSAHVDPIEAVGQREGWAIITGDTASQERTQIVEDFQAGKLKGIGLTIKAGGVGFTLTRASNMVFLDLEWVPALNEQAEGRICRIGQKSGCLYKILVADHELDELMEKTLITKRQLIDATVQRCISKVAEGASRLLDKVEGKKVEETKTYKCPCCGKPLLPRISRSEKNPGREYVNCRDCNHFAWTDVSERENMEICPTCKLPCVVRVTKKEGKNQGRRFVNCPRCGFVWVDPPKPKEKKLSRSEQVVYGKRNYKGKGGEPVIREQYTEADTKRFTEELYSLLSVCDGAVQDDCQGFNAPDAPVARVFARAIQSGEDVNWKALDDMLVKYRKTQLGEA